MDMLREAPDTAADIIARAELDRADARWWYAFGYRIGHAEGHAAAEADMATAWTAVAAGVRAYVSLTDRITSDPRPGDHPGGAVDWDTGEVIA